MYVFGMYRFIKAVTETDFTVTATEKTEIKAGPRSCGIYLAFQIWQTPLMSVHCAAQLIRGMVGIMVITG